MKSNDRIFTDLASWFCSYFSFNHFVMDVVFVGPKYVVQIGEKAVDYNENFK